MSNIPRLKAFIRVAEMQSFTKAAEALGLPKASVSGHVRQLEDELGTRLLLRTTRTVRLTPDGHAFYERSRDLVADFDELGLMFRGDSDAGVAGRLRVDMPSRFAQLQVIPRLPEFLRRYPNLQLELGSADRQVDIVREGFDCVVRVGPLGDSGLMARRLGSLPVVSVASPAYLKQYGRPRRAEDLTKHYLVNYAPTFGAKPEGFEYFDGAAYRTIKVPSLLTVSDTNAYLGACLAGLGIIQVPLLGVKTYLDSGALVEVLPKYPAEPMLISIVHGHQRNLPRRVKVFSEWLASLLEGQLV